MDPRRTTRTEAAPTPEPPRADRDQPGAGPDRVARAVHALRAFAPGDRGLAELDQVDLQILAELQGDGRITNVELARRVGLSAPPCLRRVRRLEEEGVIRGYHAVLDPQALGYEITYFALVGLETQKEAVLTEFERMVTAWPEVRECHMIRGGGDFLLRLVARDTAHENALTARLTGADHVARVQTLQTIRTARDEPGVPVPGAA